MKLDLVYDPEQRPEAQHTLRQILPFSRLDNAPEAIRQAVVAHEQERAAELDTRHDFQQLELERDAAAYKDEVALADARANSTKDPGPVNLTKHDKLQAEAKRQWGSRKIGLARAIDGVVAAFEQHGDEWEASLVQDRDDLRGKMGALLDGWQRLWEQLQVVQSSLATGLGAPRDPSVFASSFRAPAIRDGNVVNVVDAVAGMRQVGAPVEVNDGAVTNDHVPPSQQPFAGLGSQAVAVGATRPTEAVQAWIEQDEAEARARGTALAEERRNERLARADQRRTDRETRREVEDDAIAGVS